MQEHFFTISNAVYTNAAQTFLDADVDGKRVSGIHAQSRFWPSVQRFLDDGGTVAAYTPPPAPTILEQLAASDRRMLAVSARMIEDLADERVAAGKFVSDVVKAEAAARKALRAQL